MSHVDEAQVSAYVDADASLTDSERQAIEAHVSGCDACRDLIDDARETRDLASSILSRTGPESIPIPAFEDLVAISRQRAAKRKPAFTWTRGLAAAAVLVLAVSVGTLTRRGGPTPSERDVVEPVAFMDSAARISGNLQDRPIVQANENRAAPAVQTGLTSGAAVDELASVSGAPSGTGAGQRQGPEPTAPLPRRAVAAELREDDAADPVAVASGGVAPPAAAAQLGESVAPPAAAPPPAFAAEQRERLEEAARASAELRAAQVAAAEAEGAARGARTARERAARAELTDAVECRTTRAVLQTIPVVLDCAHLQGFDRDTIDATEVIRVTQSVNTRDVWLTVVPDSLVTPELSARIANAMHEKRSNATGVVRADAATETPNTISVTVGPYRVWLAGNISEEELQRLATTLITAN